MERPRSQSESAGQPPLQQQRQLSLDEYGNKCESSNSGSGVGIIHNPHHHHSRDDGCMAVGGNKNEGGRPRNASLNETTSRARGNGGK